MLHHPQVHASIGAESGGLAALEQLASVSHLIKIQLASSHS